MQPLRDALATMPSLRCLRLDGTGVQGADLPGLLTAAPNLQALGLSRCPGLARSSAPASPGAAAPSATSAPEWAAALGSSAHLRWVDLRSPGVDMASLRALGPAAAAGRLGAGSVLVDEHLARRVADAGTVAAALRVDATEEDIDGWGRADLEVRWGGGVMAWGGRVVGAVVLGGGRGGTSVRDWRRRVGSEQPAMSALTTLTPP